VERQSLDELRGMLQRNNLISNISPSLLEAAGLSNIDTSSLSVGLPATPGYALERDVLGGAGELELFMDPAKKRRLQGANARVSGSKPARGSKDSGSKGSGNKGNGSVSQGSALGKRGGRDSVTLLRGEPERPQSAKIGVGDVSVRDVSAKGGGARSDVRVGTGKSVELQVLPRIELQVLPRVGTAMSGGSRVEMGDVGSGGAVDFVPELQSAIKLPDIH